MIEHSALDQKITFFFFVSREGGFCIAVVKIIKKENSSDLGVLFIELYSICVKKKKIRLKVGAVHVAMPPLYESAGPSVLRGTGGFNTHCDTEHLE